MYCPFYMKPPKSLWYRILHDDDDWCDDDDVDDDDDGGGGGGDDGDDLEEHYFSQYLMDLLESKQPLWLASFYWWDN